MRINKFIARSGVASRRKAEEYIKNGRVKVNGNIMTELSYKVNLGKDLVEFDGKKISVEDEKKVYILLNKPAGYITTVKEQFDRPSVMDLISDIEERVYPVGRLDYETSGLLLMTNDGDLTYKLTHPSHEFKKTYIASVKGVPTKDEMKNFKEGLKIENYITAQAEIKILKTNPEKNYSVCMAVIHEGHNRQVRKMFEAIGHPVMNLKRVALGKINIKGIESGKYRKLTKSELEYLKNC